MSNTTPAQHLKTLIVAENITFLNQSFSNAPAWFIYVNLVSVLFCLLTCVFWWIAAVFMIAREKPCNHMVRDATIEETKKSNKSKKKSERSTSKRSTSHHSATDRSEGGKCAIEME
uniref:Uncharacterized protein n=1 Tax=Caenorhabditis japonica TaxID=281687 RepID=A0A8R1EPS7_CAEJA